MEKRRGALGEDGVEKDLVVWGSEKGLGHNAGAVNVFVEVPEA